MRSFGIGVVVFALAAACSPSGKEDASSAPFSVEDDGKADSLSKPVDGGLIKVGQYIQDDFKAQRGWISYDIELTPGLVDFFAHGQEADGSTPQDTILYVFGPRKANGKFPAQPRFFNDDEEPGSNVGSHILGNIPQRGVYRIVVSSYENWWWYPTNVSRGFYRVIAKCPRDGGADACGPSVVYEGGACFADADCAGGLHCEGEITCPPGTECLWVRQGTCVGDYAWLTYAPRQCGQNPWQQDPQAGDGVNPSTPDEELTAVDNYYESRGINLLALGKLVTAEPSFQCLACACARGDSLLVKAAAWDADRMVNEFGWTRVAAGTMGGYEAVQCGGNPWDEVPGDWVTEARNAATWSLASGATMQLVGFSYPAEPTAVCEACSCARGDTLVATGADAAAHSALSGLGFGDLYRP